MGRVVGRLEVEFILQKTDTGATPNKKSLKGKPGLANSSKKNHLIAITFNLTTFKCINNIINKSLSVIQQIIRKSNVSIILPNIRKPKLDSISIKT